MPTLQFKGKNSKIGIEKLSRHFSFIASMLFGFLREENKRQEEAQITIASMRTLSTPVMRIEIE